MGLQIIGWDRAQHVAQGLGKIFFFFNCGPYQDYLWWFIISWMAGNCCFTGCVISNDIFQTNNFSGGSLEVLILTWTFTFFFPEKTHRATMRGVIVLKYLFNWNHCISAPFHQICYVLPKTHTEQRKAIIIYQFVKPFVKRVGSFQDTTDFRFDKLF